MPELKSKEVELIVTSYANNVTSRGVTIVISPFYSNLLKEVVNNKWRYLITNPSKVKINFDSNNDLVINLPIEGSEFLKDFKTRPDILTNSITKIVSKDTTGFKRIIKTKEWNSIFGNKSKPFHWKAKVNFETMMIELSLFKSDEKPIKRRNSFAGENADTGFKFIHLPNSNISVTIYKKLFRELSYLHFANTSLTNFNFDEDTETVSFDIRNTTNRTLPSLSWSKSDMRNRESETFNLMHLVGIDSSPIVTESDKREMMKSMVKFREFIDEVTNNGETALYSSFNIDTEQSKIFLTFDRTDLIRKTRENTSGFNSPKLNGVDRELSPLNLNKEVTKQIEKMLEEMESSYEDIKEKLIAYINENL
ncbi:hypothetical protein [Proteus mirabilis]|uniref:hypothetical protein n=1 Tax=Proteus mirabilis TaxID=584 RepID=UPI0034D4E742